VNYREIFELGVVEGVRERVQLATSLNWLEMQAKILVQCIHLFYEASGAAGCFICEKVPLQSRKMRASARGNRRSLTEHPPFPLKGMRPVLQHVAYLTGTPVMAA